MAALELRQQAEIRARRQHPTHLLIHPSMDFHPDPAICEVFLKVFQLHRGHVGHQVFLKILLLLSDSIPGQAQESKDLAYPIPDSSVRNLTV